MKQKRSYIGTREREKEIYRIAKARQMNTQDLGKVGVSRE